MICSGLFKLLSVCPLSAQGPQRNMRTPGLDTLRLSGPPQNPQSGVVIAFLKALPLSFRYDIAAGTSSEMEGGQPQKGANL
jgi:hypothetical protein